MIRRKTTKMRLTNGKHSKRLLATINEQDRLDRLANEKRLYMIMINDSVPFIIIKELALNRSLYEIITGNKI